MTFDFGEDRLRGRGSLPATFYVLTRVKSVSYTHLDVYKRQLYNLGLYANNLLILFEFAAVIVCFKKFK